MKDKLTDEQVERFLSMIEDKTGTVRRYGEYLQKQPAWALYPIITGKEIKNEH